MKFLSALTIVLLLVSCQEDPVIRATVKGEDKSKDIAIEKNVAALRIEQQDIENYIRRHGLETVKTGTGVHISFFEDIEGEAVRPEEEVLIEHTISLLNGKECYASEQGAPEAFFVEHDDVESGLHEAIQYLSPGDSALIIIPSYLAHGLAGDLNKIPMRSTVVYHIRLLAAR